MIGSMWILRCPTDETLVFRVAPGNIKTFGRAPRADFIVDAALVSRLHCRVEAAFDALTVVDLSSTNGTFVNGKRVPPGKYMRLSPGDFILIGRTKLSLHHLGVESPS